ncbi:hypothetical protein J6590_079920 [Homalodisca vitripennis]|nr:hypothetical protein J6590_079920 [Homalodisca vitripennis]
MITVASRPLNLTAGGIYPLNLETFSYVSIHLRIVRLLFGTTRQHFKTSLGIMLRRATRSIHLTSGEIYPLNLETFSYVSIHLRIIRLLFGTTRQHFKTSLGIMLSRATRSIHLKSGEIYPLNLETVSYVSIHLRIIRLLFGTTRQHFKTSLGIMLRRATRSIHLTSGEIYPLNLETISYVSIHLRIIRLLFGTTRQHFKTSLGIMLSRATRFIHLKSGEIYPLNLETFSYVSIHLRIIRLLFGTTRQHFKTSLGIMLSRATRSIHLTSGEIYPLNL